MSSRPQVVCTAPSQSGSNSHNSHHSGSSGQPPSTNTSSSPYIHGNTAGSSDGFVPAGSYPSSSSIESMSSVERARLDGVSSSGAITSYVKHGNPTGYYIQSRGNVSVHQTERGSRGQIPQLLGPAFATGPDHSQRCRLLTQYGEYQWTCFCDPEKPRN